MVTVRVEPSSVGVAPTLLQCPERMSSVFCCNTKPVEGDGHEITTVFVVVRKMASRGAHGISATGSKPQKPPATEYLPAHVLTPASGWPIVAVTENTPPVLVPPPASTVDQSTDNWAGAGRGHTSPRLQHPTSK